MASLPADTAAGSTFFEGSHEEDEENKAPEPNRSSDADDPGILKAPPEHLRFTSSSTQKACMVSESFVSRSADEGSSVCLALRPVHPDRNGGGRCPYTAAPMPSPRREGSPLGDLRIRAVSKVFLRLEEAPRAVRDLWKISFEGKQLRRRKLLFQIDLNEVCSWISVRLETDLLPPCGALADSSAYADATAVYGQLVPQLLWAAAVAMSALISLTLQEATALWARLQLLALDATSISAVAAADNLKSGNASAIRRQEGFSGLCGRSRVFGRRKRRRSQHQQQQQQGHDDQQFAGDTSLQLADVAESGAEPEFLLQRISNARKEPREVKGPAALTRYLGSFDKLQSATLLSPSAASSPFAALRQDLMQLGALRSPGGGGVPLRGASSTGSSTTSLGAFAPHHLAAAAVSVAESPSSKSKQAGTSRPEHWALMSWQSAAAAAAAAAAAVVQQGLSRRSSFSSVASDLLPPSSYQQQQHHGLLAQEPLSLEVAVGAAVDPRVASPFRLQQHQQRSLLPSEPSSIDSENSKRTRDSMPAIRTPDGWAADPSLLEQQDGDLGGWHFPEEDSGWAQGKGAEATAAETPQTPVSDTGEVQLALAVPGDLRLQELVQRVWATDRPKRRPGSHQKVQLDKIISRSALNEEAAAAAKAEKNRNSAPGTGVVPEEPLSASMRLLQEGTEDSEALKRNFRCYSGMLKRQLCLRALLRQHQEQHLLSLQKLPRKRLDSGQGPTAGTGGMTLALLLSGAHCRPLLPSAAEAASAALRGCSLGGPVKTLQQQKQCELQKHTATESVQALTARCAVGRPWFRETPNGVDNSLEATREASDAAADAARTTADAAAAAAAAVARRRRSSWLDRENVLRGFESPLPPAEFSEGNEPEPWVDTNWEDAADEYHQQAQVHHQKQQEQHKQGRAKESLGIFAEEPRRQQQDPHVNETSLSPIHGNSQGLYRKKDGAIITLWPSAADLFELVERHYVPGAAGFASHPYNTPPPPSAAPSPASLSTLLNGRSRRTAARAFRDALTLHSYGLCFLKQDMPEPSEKDALGYPPLLIFSQDAAEARELLGSTAKRAAATAAATSYSADAAQSPAPTAAAAANAGADAVTALPKGTSVEPCAFPLVNEGTAGGIPSVATKVTARPQAAAVAALAADAAAAEAADTGMAPISDEQLEQAVQWLVTGLLDRLQEQSRLHAHELVHWFVHELLPSSDFAHVATPAAWEAKAVYAICTLIDEGVFVASAAALDEAPVRMKITDRVFGGNATGLECPFWLEGVADVD